MAFSKIAKLFPDSCIEGYANNLSTAGSNCYNVEKF